MLIIYEQKLIRTVTGRSQICVFDRKTFCTLCTCVSSVLFISQSLVHCATWNDLFCSSVHGVSTWRHVTHSCFFLCSKRPDQFNSRIVSSHPPIYSSRTSKTIPYPAAHTYIAHILEYLLHNPGWLENHSCQASENADHLFCTTGPTWNNRKTLHLFQRSVLMWR